MSDAAAEDIRHIFGQELRVPFIPPSLLLLLLPAPCHPARARPEMCCIRARGEEGALRDSVGLFEWVLNFIQLLLEEGCPELLAHTANRSLVVILSLSSFSFLS